MNGYFEKINKNKHLTLVPTNESKDITKTMKNCEETEILLGQYSKNSDDYDVKYLKIKSNLDEELPLNKTIEIPSMIIAVGAVFHKNDKHYPQVFLNECLYKLRII